MSEANEGARKKADADLEREIRDGRKFTLEEAIGRLAGPGAMKGESPVARMEQAGIEIESWLRSHLTDSAGALTTVLGRAAKASELLLNNFDQPLTVLAACCEKVLDSEHLLTEVVRQADVEWGRVMGERPYFEKKGTPPHPDDPYTIESVRNTVSDLLNQLRTGATDKPPS